MTGKEFNQEILNYIQNEMTGQVRLVFKYRHGLADGIWYRLDEICDALKLTREQCVRLLRIGRDELLSKWLASECDNTAHTDLASLNWQTTAGEHEGADLDIMKAASVFQRTAEGHGYSFDLLGNSTLPDGVFARITRDAHYLVLIEPRRTQWLSKIVAILFRHRNEHGDHSGGSHMAVLGCASDLVGVTQAPILVDVELFDTPFAFNWTVEAGLRASLSVEEPWFYQPLS